MFTNKLQCIVENSLMHMMRNIRLQSMISGFAFPYGKILTKFSFLHILVIYWNTMSEERKTNAIIL